MKKVKIIITYSDGGPKTKATYDNVTQVVANTVGNYTPDTGWVGKLTLKLTQEKRIFNGK